MEREAHASNANAPANPEHAVPVPVLALEERLLHFLQQFVAHMQMLTTPEAAGARSTASLRWLQQVVTEPLKERYATHARAGAAARVDYM